MKNHPTCLIPKEETQPACALLKFILTDLAGFYVSAKRIARLGPIKVVDNFILAVLKSPQLDLRIP